MRFTTARLCGGKSFMAIPAGAAELDLSAAAAALEKAGIRIQQQDEMMLVFQWNGLETTLYPQGKVMFFPLEDRALCIKYATDLLGMLM
ncbi:MAG: hypothetical protein J5494_02170 [Candidatus Methanomethylophilaceae archaeon]|nr:hypothetical protein [Candidatus Methanomethylophilaceae archaeon]